MFGPNNFLVLDAMTDLRQQEIRQQVKQYQLMDIAAQGQPGLSQRLAWYVGKASISFGQWLQNRSEARLESQNELECA